MPLAEFNFADFCLGMAIVAVATVLFFTVKYLRADLRYTEEIDRRVSVLEAGTDEENGPSVTG